MAAAVQQSNPFIKQLGANDRKTRDRAITQLRTFLSRSTAFTHLDLLKLWKGFFYAMWSADKPRYQQALARDLASLHTVFSSNANTLLFIRCFWETMGREWGGIESLRMDKFLYLVRVFIAQSFTWLARDGWKDAESRTEFLEILEHEGPMNAREVKVPNGLRYHVLDIYVDELDKADGERSAPVEEMMGPITRLSKDCPVKSVRERAREALDDSRLADWKGENINDEEDEDEEEGTDDKNSDDEFGGFDD
ncbi:hypothetical protein AAFC00_000375 [Neodothiora populina]|uniref:Uncharacterized protein n=1 Tax=Neodothiora populina TaxID=2781224 RepID=A0ABR3PDV7_9PEZI